MMIIGDLNIDSFADKDNEENGEKTPQLLDFYKSIVS